MLIFEVVTLVLRRHFLDSCVVDNGGCCNNAECSHEYSTNEVKCTCKVGYTDTGAGKKGMCIGKNDD